MTLDEELEVAVRLVAMLRDPLRELWGRDRGLADYLRRASCNLAVAISEARWHEGAERLKLVKQAAENASEVFSALQLAESWGHLRGPVLLDARRLLDQELNLLSGTPATKLAG